MSDPTPSTEPIDRRAADAVARLDEAVDAVSIPDFAGPAHGHPTRRRIQPAAIAAALLVIALVTAGFLLTGGDDEQGTIAGEVEADDNGEFVHLFIPEPAAAGLEVIAAYDGLGTPTDNSSAPTLHAPVGADDPWASVVEVAPSPDDRAEPRVYGEVVDLGDVEGAVSAFGVPSIMWISDDGHLHSISSPVLDEDELVELARTAVAEGWRTGQPLPGHEIFTEVASGDGYPILASLTASNRAPIAGVGYRSDELEFVLGSVPGGEDRYRALQRYAETEPIRVRGRDGVLLRYPYGRDLVEILWRENDGTIGRVDTFDDPAVVIEALGTVEPTTSASFDALVESHPLVGDQPMLEIPSSQLEGFGDPFEDRPDGVLAELAVERDGLQAKALVYPEGDDPVLASLVDDANGASGGTVPIVDLDRPAVDRYETGGRTVYTGVAPGTVGTIEVERPDGAIPIVDLEQTRVADSPAVLFVAWSEQTIDDATVLRITLRDGRVIRFAV